MAYYPKDRNPSGVIFFGDGGQHQVLESESTFVYKTGDGYLGIGTNNPFWELDVSGTGTFREIRWADGTSQTSAAAGAYTFDTAAGNETAVTINNADVLRFSGLDGIAVTRSSQTMQFDLKDTAVTPGSYGDASTISTFTVDQQGRLTSAGETSVSITASQVSDFDSTVSGLVFVGNNFVDSDTFDFGVTAGTSVSGNVKFNSINENYLTTSIAGDGLAGGNGTALSVNVDDSTIEINTDTLRVKDAGITNAKLENSSVTITAGNGLIDGGSVSLGGSVTINASNATTSQSGITQLQDSATNGTVDKAITPNAVYDISGNLQSSIDGKDNYQYWNITDGVTSENISSTNQVKFTGAGATHVGYNASNNTVTVTTAAGTTYTAGTGLTLDGSDVFHANVDPAVQTEGSQPVTTTSSRTYAVQVDASDELVVNVPWVDTDTIANGPAQTIAFYSGDGSITGDSSLTYNESATSIKLTTQGDTLTTGFYIANNQTQSGNMFQVDTYVEGISKVDINAEVTADAGDGYVSTSTIGSFVNTGPNLALIGGATNFSSGVLPFNIPNFDADLAADTVTGAYATLFNYQTTSDIVSGLVAVYTGDADPTIPTNDATFYSLGALTGINVPFNLLNHAGSTGNASVSDELLPALQQYWGLHPSNTGNIILYWKSTAGTSDPSNNNQISADFSDTGVHPRLTLNYTYYSGDGSFTEKTSYVVDHQGKVRLNIDDYQNVGNSIMIYASGQQNLPCDVVLNSNNDRSKIVHKRNDQKLFSMGSNTDGTNWNVFDHVNASRPLSINNKSPKYRTESVVMQFKGGQVGIYDLSPIYDLDIDGDLGVRSGIYLYNGLTVGFDDTSHRVYRSGDVLMWNGAPVTGAPGGSMTSWDLRVGTEASTAISDSETVTFTGLNEIITTRSSNQISVDIDLSSYYTSAQVDTISGNLQSSVDAKDNYQYWTITDGVTSENISSTNQVKFTGGGATQVGYNASNNTVTITTAAGTTYTAGSGITLNANTFDANVDPTVQTEGAQSVTSTAGKTYAVQVDASDYMVVNVPWVNTTYTAGSGLVLDGTTIDAQVDNSTIEIATDTFQVKDGGITNAKLANSSITITPGTGIGNAGSVSLGSSVTINANSATTSQVGVVQLQDSATNGTVDKAITPNAVYDISGNLQTSIDAKDNYQYWTLKGDAATTTNVDTTEQVEFNGAGGTTVALGGTDNRVVTITSTDTTYTAGSGLVLNGTTIDAQVDNSTIEINSDTFRVKDGGITNAKLANSSITLTADVGSNETVSLGDTLDIAGGSGISTTVGATDTVTVNLTATAVTAGSYGSASQVGTFTVDANGRLTAAGNTTIDITASQVSDFNSASETAIFTDANFVDSSTIDFTVSAGASVTAAVPDSGITELKRYRTVDSSLVDTNTISKDINLVSAAGGNVLVNLPAPPISAGRLLYVKKTDSSTNTVTIDQNGSETIDGGTSYVLYNQFESVTLICDGTNWHVF